ncbi:MAG: hypothetical protein H7Z42_03990 [Roseiflexaceae bacterium]|nr:hypothetical protein [Roseiflexaceae bacterium]
MTDQLVLPCQLTRIVPGALHADGRRYLPTLVLRLADGFELGVVDRHHRVGPEQAGRVGVARLVFLLSRIRQQVAPFHQGLQAASGANPPHMRPLAAGKLLAVPSWQHGRGVLPYETLYTELLLDLGVGVVGVRTNATAPSIAALLGTDQLHPGDWVTLDRSRIDILGFES